MSPTLIGAILQRDGSYAIMTNNPAGLITPEELERIAAVGRKFQVPYLKITPGQRIILAGIKPEDVATVFADLSPRAKPESGPGVKFVQACLGTEMCKYGSQDSIALARMIGEKVKDRSFPATIKMGVSGCQRCCSESQVRDIGLIGTIRRWIIFFSGNGGTKPRFGDLLASGLSADEAIDCVLRILDYYAAHANPKERTTRFIERIGIETLKSELLSTIPYIP